MSGLDNCPAITNDNHYPMGPPGGVAFHGAARSRNRLVFWIHGHHHHLHRLLILLMPVLQ